MKAIAHADSSNSLVQNLEIRDHSLIADEPSEMGGEDRGPTPQELLAASLAACTAITIQMYARRKEWKLGEIEVECEYEPADKGAPTEFKLAIRLPGGLTPDQIERLEKIAAKCPVHRTLAGDVRFEQRTELVETPA
jgi:putative redox protein